MGQCTAIFISKQVFIFILLGRHDGLVFKGLRPVLLDSCADFKVNLNNNVLVVSTKKSMDE